MKNRSRPQKRKSARSALIGSTLAIVLSCVLFAGTTWAWLSIKYASTPVTLASANFGVELTVTDKSGNTLPAAETGIWKLGTGYYTVTLTRTGSSADSLGYCSVVGGDVTYRSPNLIAEESFSFPLQLLLQEDSVFSLSYTPVWDDTSTQPDLELISAETGIRFTDPDAANALNENPEEDEPMNEQSEPGAKPEPSENSPSEVPPATDDNPDGDGDEIVTPPTEGDDNSGNLTTEGDLNSDTATLEATGSNDE
jgi:hypothetical protein